MQVRFQFKRGDELKFIGHLDILRVFERAFKRAELPISHSQGFNPRPQVVFGQPMPLGLTSDGEFADVQLDADMDPTEFMRRLNASLPPGLKLVDAGKRENQSNIMSQVGAARYRIEVESPGEIELPGAIGSIMEKEEIITVKKTKSGEKEINIRPLVFDISVWASGSSGYFDVLLGAGQENNVRPELFLSGVNKVCGLELEMQRMHRFMLYGRAGGHWLSLMDKALL